MKKIANGNVKSFPYRTIIACLCILALLCPLFVVMAENWQRAALHFQQVILAGMLIMLFIIRKKDSPEGKLLAAFFVWDFFTRWLLGDLQTGFRASTLYAAEAYGVFCVGYALEPTLRKKLLNWFTAIICGILFVWAVCGILTVLKGSGLPLVRNQIFLMDEIQDGHHLRSLVFFNLHRNETAPWFMIAMWLMVYQWFSCRNKKWRCPIALTGVLFYITVALQHCRTVYIATAGGFAMLAVLLLMPGRNAKGKFRRWILTLLVAAACLGVCYKGFSVCDQVISKTAQTTSRIYNQMRGFEQETSEEEDAAFIDDRSLLKDMKTVTGRKSIWRAIYRTRTKDLRIALFGQPENDVIPLLMEKGGLKYKPNHAHNMFMQALTVNGIPGMLIMLAFVVLIVIRVIRLFFRNGVPVAQSCLTIPPATLLVYGMAESLLSNKFWFVSCCFMVLSGIMVAWEQESGAISEKNAEYAQAIL